MEKLLENDQIRLRALEPEDLEPLYSWENSTEWWGAGYTLAPYSRFLLKTYIEESHRDIYDSKQLRLIIELKEGNKAIGMVDLYDFDPHNKRAGVGILLDKEYQGNGYAKESIVLLVDYAFGFLKLHQLYVHIPVSNENSQTLFSGCGFTTSGVLKDWLERSNTFEDVLVMQLINR